MQNRKNRRIEEHCINNNRQCRYNERNHIHMPFFVYFKKRGEKEGHTLERIANPRAILAAISLFSDKSILQLNSTSLALL